MRTASYLFCASLLWHGTVARAQTMAERVDPYFSDGQNAPAHRVHGSLEQRPLFVRESPGQSHTRGAVLRSLLEVSHATLAPGIATERIHLQGEQEVIFVVAGGGTALAGSQSVPLSRNTVLLAPAETTWQLRAAGAAPLELYIVREPVPAGFHPGTALVSRNEGATPIASTDRAWSEIVKPLLSRRDGLSTLTAVETVTLDPLTVSRPLPLAHADTEELWIALDGESLALLGNQLRRLKPGEGYVHLPAANFPASNLNPSEAEAARYLHLVCEGTGPAPK